MTGEVINGLHIRQGALLLEPRELYDSAIVATTQTGSTGENAMSDQEAVDHFNFNVMGGSFAEAEDIRPFFRDPIDGEIF